MKRRPPARSLSDIDRLQGCDVVDRIAWEIRSRERDDDRRWAQHLRQQARGQAARGLSDGLGARIDAAAYEWRTPWSELDSHDGAI